MYRCNGGASWPFFYRFNQESVSIARMRKATTWKYFYTRKAICKMNVHFIMSNFIKKIPRKRLYKAVKQTLCTVKKKKKEILASKKSNERREIRVNFFSNRRPLHGSTSFYDNTQQVDINKISDLCDICLTKHD